MMFTRGFLQVITKSLRRCDIITADHVQLFVDERNRNATITFDDINNINITITAYNDNCADIDDSDDMDTVEISWTDYSGNYHGFTSVDTMRRGFSRTDIRMWIAARVVALQNSTEYIRAINA